MEAPYIFLKKVDLDKENRFEIDLNRDNIVESLKYSLRRKCFLTNLKVNANIKTDIKKSNDYNRIQELSKFCRKLIKESKKINFNSRLV